jgi:hypothetical protein
MLPILENITMLTEMKKNNVICMINIILICFYGKILKNDSTIVCDLVLKL